jgi:hypothetical protein
MLLLRCAGGCTCGGRCGGRGEDHGPLDELINGGATRALVRRPVRPGTPTLQRQADDAAVHNGSASGVETAFLGVCEVIPVGRCTPCIPWPTSSTGFRRWCHSQVCGNIGCADSCDPHDC